jgi:hypothetical protein
MGHGKNSLADENTNHGCFSFGWLLLRAGQNQKVETSLGLFLQNTRQKKRKIQKKNDGSFRIIL